jgi:hypothetical protein
MASLAAMLEVRADLVSLVILDRTGVGLPLSQAEFTEYVKNLTALDFHLTCEIVNSNLAHPPLFRMCYPLPLVAHSYLVALVCCVATIPAPSRFRQRKIFVAAAVMVLESATH